MLNNLLASSDSIYSESIEYNAAETEEAFLPRKSPPEEHKLFL